MSPAPQGRGMERGPGRRADECPHGLSGKNPRIFSGIS